jgi:hypothetical protein
MINGMYVPYDTTEEASPGVLTRIEVVDPPYRTPIQILAEKIMAATGGRPKGKGRVATRPTVPIPGRTPTSVPIKTPIEQQKRFLRVEMAEKPKIMLCSVSIT